MLSVNDTEFTAELRDQTEPSTPSENATLPLDSVYDEDLPLVVPGAVFYWQIAYVTEGGTKRLVSEVRFRRLPAWSRQDVLRARRAAADLAALFSSSDS